ncbi:MAG TPA: FAD:protein FMN transferase [Chitinophagaceae bacterium]|nr:FAD:protein FMN transferase [Chitinophagaceae bacterium]
MIPAAYKKVTKLMGNQFELTVVATLPEWAEERMEEAIREIRRIEAVFTTFRDDSETNRINRQAGIAPVEVSEEMIRLIERSIRISCITQGAFDITYGSIDKRLWNFDQQMDRLPSRRQARRLVRLINYRHIEINHEARTVFLKEKGMRIGFGGIAKGYAAEKAKQCMIQSGVTSGIVNASGDLAAWGTQPDGKPWTIGIVHPDYKNYPFAYLEITDRAVATSGNYEKFVMIGGKKYSHTIDPRTGLPVTGIKSVTIISPNAELSDALATPVTILGVEAGLDLVNQLRDIACVIIDDRNRIYTSHNIHLQ